MDFSRISSLPQDSFDPSTSTVWETWIHLSDSTILNIVHESWAPNSIYTVWSTCCIQVFPNCKKCLDVGVHKYVHSHLIFPLYIHCNKMPSQRVANVLHISDILHILFVIFGMCFVLLQPKDKGDSVWCKTSSIFKSIILKCIVCFTNFLLK